MSKVLVSPSPHIHADISTARIMRDVVIALLPSVAVSILYYGWHSVMLLAVSVITCILVEYLITRFLLKNPCTISDWSAAVTGVLLALNLPPACPWWVAMIGAIFAIGVVKMTFGGLGQNLFNPAIAARVFLLVSFPVAMTNWARPAGFLNVDATSGATLLGTVKEGLAKGDTLSQIFAANDFSYLQTLFINIGGSAGEISAIAILVGFIYLLARKVIRPHITLSIWATVIVFSGIFWLINPDQYTDPLFNLLTGGLCDISNERQGRYCVRCGYRASYHADKIFRLISGRRIIRHPHNELSGAAHQQGVQTEKIREGIDYGSTINIKEHGTLSRHHLPCEFSGTCRCICLD